MQLSAKIAFSHSGWTQKWSINSYIKKNKSGGVWEEAAEAEEEIGENGGDNGTVLTTAATRARAS